MINKRTVIVYSPSGASKTSVETSAKTWIELQTDLNEHSINFKGMKAIVADTKNTLEADSAVLPSGNFTLFLMVAKNDSGTEYQDLKAKVKAWRLEAVENEDEELMRIIGNYTILDLDEMKSLVEEIEEYLSVGSAINDSNLEARVFEVEFKLGIKNEENSQRFEERLDGDLKKVYTEVQSEIKKK